MAGNITTSTGKAFVVGTMSTEALTALFDLRWMLVLIVVLIVADFWFGVSESIKRHEHLAPCSAWLSSNRWAGLTTSQRRLSAWASGASGR